MMNAPSPVHILHTDAQVSQSWRLACPLKRFPLIWLTLFAVPFTHKRDREQGARSMTKGSPEPSYFFSTTSNFSVR